MYLQQQRGRRGAEGGAGASQSNGAGASDLRRCPGDGTLPSPTPPLLSFFSSSLLSLVGDAPWWEAEENTVLSACLAEDIRYT